MNVLIADCETDGLLDTYTRIWCIQLGSVDGEDVTVYADQPGYPPIQDGLDRMAAADRLVFHNGLRFDMEAVNRLHPGAIRLEQVYDTLVAVRLLNPEERANALDDWGTRLKVLKGKYEGDFQSFTPELVQYARQDIHVTRTLYRWVEPRLRTWEKNGVRSIDLEHQVAYVISLQERNGFCLNEQKCEALEQELSTEREQIERELLTIFPPIWVADKVKDSAVVTPKRDNRKMGYTEACPFSRVKLQEFKPGSETQVAARLTAKYGWRPTKFTPTGQAQVDETVLSALPYAECKPLLRYLRVTKQLGQLSDGKGAWLKLVKFGRVYGAVNPNGCPHGRMSHFSPNMAQVDKKDLRMREVWEPRPGWKLVGVDAEGAQARMLGHYLHPWDGGAFGDRVVNGKSELGTDVHTVNQRAIDEVCSVTRDGAKRILYALMFGAGDGKLGWIAKDDCRNARVVPPKASDRTLGGKIRAQVAVGIVGIDKLIEALKKAVRSCTRPGRKGYLIGLDGRRIFMRSEHSSLNFLLTAGEAVLMKLALVIFHFELTAGRYEFDKDFAYCANVHDEVQLEARPEIAAEIGSLFADAIRIAGERLGLLCAMAGKAVVGNNWKDTH